MKSTKAKISAIALPALSLLFPMKAYAQAWTSGKGGCEIDGVATIKGIECLFQNVVAYALRLIGLVAVIMLVIGAFKILTSGGDPKSAEAGKNTLTMAVLGIVIAVSAWFILLIIRSVTGVDVGEFSIPTN